MGTDYPIGELKIQTHEHSRLLLGSFRKDASPRGFSVHITPQSEQEAVVSRVISLEKKGGIFNLIMYIENYGSKTVKAQVWPM